MGGFDDHDGDFDDDDAAGGGFNSETLAPPQTSVSDADDMEEVKRELNEAIQKDMELLPSMMNAHDDLFDSNQKNAVYALFFRGDYRSPRSVEEGEPSREAPTPPPQPKPEKGGKEILLNAE